MSNKLRKGIAGKIAITFLSFSTAFTISGASVALPLVANAALTEAQIQSIISLLQSFGADQTTINNVNSSLRGQPTTPSPAPSGSCNFTRSLTVGSQGEDVRCLQQYLNSAGFPVASTGVGSPGNETTYFGPLTQSAVAKWQAANAVSPSVGYFGPISQAKYNSLVAQGPSTPPTTPPTAPGSGLTVSPGTQPAASLAPQNAARVPYTRIRLSASPDGPVTVNSITVERTGLMQDSAISGVVILDDQGRQITNVAKSLNANHQAILNDAFTIPAGQTKEYTIAANMPASLTARAGEVGFLSVVAVNANASVTGVLPITGAGHTINATLSIGSVTMAVGPLDPRNSPTKEVGSTAYVFSSVKLTAGSAEDVQVEQIRWNQSGSAAVSDLANLMSYDDRGNTYSMTVSSDGKYYTAVFSPPVSVAKGDSLELYVKGDIADGSGRTIDFDIYRNTDLVVKGKNFGYYVTPPNGTTDPTDDTSAFSSTNPWYDASQVTVGAGSLRVEKSNTVPAGNVAVGGTNQALGAFIFEAKGEPVNFNSLVLTITTTDSDAGLEAGTDLTNVTFYDENGSAIIGPKDFVKTSITFTDSVTVPVGTHTYTVRGKLASTGWENNDTIALSFTPSTAITSVTGQTTGNTITPTPATSVAANTQTVKAASLTVTPSGSLPAQNVIIGANAVELGRFTVDATNSGEDVRITIIQIRADVTTMDLDELNTIQLFDGATALNTGSNILNPSGNTAGTDANITITLDTPLIVTKGTNKIISLKANASTALSASDKIAFDFSAGSPDWTVTGVNSGATVTETLNTTAGSIMTFQTGGGYEITEDTSAGQTEAWYPSGSAGVTIGAFRFRATSEAFAVKAFQVQLTNTASSSATDMTALYLYDGSTLIAKKTFPAFTSNVENFSFNVNGAQGDGSANSPTNYLEIPADNFKIITAKVDLVTINTNIGASGSLLAVDTGPGSNQRQRAVGKGSGTEVSPAVWSVAGTTVGTTTVSGTRYFRGVPKVELVTLPGGTTLTSGAKIYRFKITAQGGDVGIYKWTIKVSTSGNAAMTVDQLVLRNETLAKDVTNAVTLVGTTSCAGLVQPTGHQTCNFDTNGDAIIPLVVDNDTNFSTDWVRIPAGQTHEFSVRANSVTLVAATTGEKVTTQLLGDAAYPIASTTASGSKNTFKVADVEQDIHDDFIWTDFLAEATTTATSVLTNDWTNGFRVAGLEGDLDAVTVSE